MSTPDHTETRLCGNQPSLYQTMPIPEAPMSKRREKSSSSAPRVTTPPRCTIPIVIHLTTLCQFIGATILGESHGIAKPVVCPTDRKPLPAAPANYISFGGISLGKCTTFHRLGARDHTIKTSALLGPTVEPTKARYRVAGRPGHSPVAIAGLGRIGRTRPDLRPWVAHK